MAASTAQKIAQLEENPILNALITFSHSRFNIKMHFEHDHELT
jgi:hypothetical protein